MNEDIELSKIISELEQLDKKLLEVIEKILGTNPSKEKLLDFLASPEFDQMINDLGLENIKKRYANGFDFIFQQGIKKIGNDIPAQQLRIIANNLELIKATNGRTVLGYFGYQTENLRRDLIASIVNGKKYEDIVKSFGSKIIGVQNPHGAYYQGKLHIFSEANVKAVIGTSYFDYSRSTTRQIWMEQPDTKFYYGGLLKETSSDECEWFIKKDNQKPEGYTMAEIDKGIETPFVYTYGDNKGQTKIIDWWGRKPNFNCPHTWRKIDNINPTTNKYDEEGRRIE